MKEPLAKFIRENEYRKGKKRKQGEERTMIEKKDENKVEEEHLKEKARRMKNRK